MDKTFKIVFFGTPEFATGVLETLYNSHHQIVAVVTAVDKPAGRGRKLNESHVKQFAIQNDIPVLQPNNLKSPEFIEELRSYKADLQVIVAFRMLPKVVWSMPALGTFNLHASLLPEYRGAAPINWAIINQESQSGVTTFFIDEKIDTGAIIDQQSCDIEENETVGTLYKKLMDMGSTLSLQTVNNIATGQITTQIQPMSDKLKEAPKLNATNTTIDWNKTTKAVDAMVRGLYPFPVAKAVLIQDKNETIKIYKTTVELKNHKMKPGSIVIEDDVFKVACTDGFLIIDEMQLPNKKRMDVKSLLNGYKFSADARFHNGLL
ncbi:methionyl-tRNA formyltransferase [Nonlabens arenilitoris]|uniref:Methionyl-tRNA formyltransferase n=1 Tax=Nonlabens arenilitoris TaxID=1217969 RepID=A0A2S7UEP8_9FLAO|nr:methionyl-tRNA formyltransferase [Nonlabens arenilitoris]PQJ32763.1 methionyl-tRNA formyltransferase [Nonlabens arenilitoris]